MVIVDPHANHKNENNMNGGMAPFVGETSIPMAFKAACDEDVRTTLNVLANPSTPHNLRFYMVPCHWMNTCRDYLLGNTNDRPMDKVNNCSLLDNHKISSSEDEDDDNNNNKWRQEHRQNLMLQQQEQNQSTSSIKYPLAYGLDYYLVGPNTWTLLSHKFGYDVELAKPVEKHPVNFGLIVRLNQDTTVEIPATGRFDIGMTNNNHAMKSTDVVSEDDDDGEEEPNDLFPSEEENGPSHASASQPLLMLPPSTTATNNNLYGGDHYLRNNHQVLYPRAQQAMDDNNHDSKKVYHARGLGNLGNTCFMNSTLQCLAHTHPLRRYFLSGEYQDDLNRNNPLGAQGELATEFARLLKEMWGQQPPQPRTAYSSYNSSYYSSSVVYPRNFKGTLGKHAEQFLGYDQHDSHELATYLLDALHEDTNRVTKKPYIEKPEQGDNEADDAAAQKAWQVHLQREDSRVLEQFMGQVKSRVQCPVESCGRVSTTFDPFMYLSVPIPGATDRTLPITFVPLNPNEKHKTLSVTLSKTSSMVTLQKKIVELLQSSGEYQTLQPQDVCLADVWSNEVYHFHKPRDEIDKIRDSDTTFAFELRSISSIHAEEAETMDQSVDDPNWDSGKRFKCQRIQLPLDVLEKFKNDQDWMNVLETYVRQPTQLYALFNVRRRVERLEDSISCLHRLEDFVESLHLASDARGEGSSEDMDETDEEKTPEKDHEEPTLEDLCARSAHFRNVRTTQDLGILECCINKFRKFITDVQREQKEKSKDGIIIQVVFQRKPPTNRFLHHNTYHSTTTSSDRTFALPLTLRIPPSMTVYGLREELSRRISRSLKRTVPQSPTTDLFAPEQDTSMTTTTSSVIPDDEDNGNDTNVDAQLPPVVSEPESPHLGSPELLIMRQIPLTYDHKATEYGAYKTSTQTLGMLEPTHEAHDGNRPISLASPTDEEEVQKVCELVEQCGAVHLHWPTTLSEDYFDVAEYEASEEWRPKKSDGEEKMTTRRSAKKAITVFDCIERYCQMEQLEDSEMWYCNRCKEHVRAWKQFHLYRTPPILIIHLKRFHYSATTHRRDKIDTYVDFPLKGLDLSNEVMQWTEDEKPIYDLYAVSNHFGGLGGGHYTAYALSDDGEWCNFDDSRVTTNVDPEEVKSSAAYVLYYRRRDVVLDDGVEDVVPATPPVTQEMRTDPPAIVRDHEPAPNNSNYNMYAVHNEILETRANPSSSEEEERSQGSSTSPMDEEEHNYYDQEDNYAIGGGQIHDRDEYPLQ